MDRRRAFIAVIANQGAAAPAFNPLTDVANPENWKFWVESDGDLFQDAAKTTPATANNDVVGAWVDQAATPHDATQATADNKPKLKTNIVGSLPGIFFDGVNDVLRTAAFETGIGFGGYTLFISAITNGGANQSAFGMGAALELYLLGTANVVYQFGNNWRGYETDLDTEPHVVTFRRPNDSSGRTRLYVDGTLDAGDDPVNIDNAGWSNQALSVGDAGEGSYPFSGYLFGIGLYAGTMSDADRAATENYFLGKL